jgi:hypothetical protein
MIGGMVETSASFEARYAPLSHPTAGGEGQLTSLPRLWQGRMGDRSPYADSSRPFGQLSIRYQEVPTLLRRQSPGFKLVISHLGSI